MVALTIRGMRGEIPRTSPRLLQPQQATRARNVVLTAGRLDPLPGTTFATKPGLTGVKSMFRYRYIDTSGQVLDNWLVWGSDVDAVQSPLTNDAQGKVYFTSEDFEPRMTTYANAISGAAPFPHAWFVLGVAAPTAAPALAVTGGTGATEARAYVYTLVTPFGEESAPSPASAVVTGFTNGTWNVTGMQVAPLNNGSVTALAKDVPGVGFIRLTFDTTFGIEAGEQVTVTGATGMTDLNRTHRIVSVDKANNFVVVQLLTSQVYTGGAAWRRTAPHNTTGMTKRVYRSAGLTNPDFLFVAELAVGTTTYADTLAATALGESIATTQTMPPPKNLKCLVSLPNGCLVGIADNEVCFSDPYLPYSWPQGNRYSFSGRGVALSASGNSVIVLTDTFPVLFVGSDPEAMSPSVMETYAPCASKRGTVSIGGGCIYPSHDGLWMAVPGSVTNLTQNLYRLREWQLVNPTSFVAEVWDGQYIASFRDPLDATKNATLILDINERDSISFVDTSVDYMERSEYDGLLYVLIADSIYSWATSSFARFPSDWISGALQLAKPTNLAAAQVHADFSEAVQPDQTQIAANQAIFAGGANALAGDVNGAPFLDMEVDGSNLVLTDTSQFQRKVQFTLYSNGVAVFSREVTSSSPFRLPSGYLTEVYNIGLNASVPVHSVAVATSMAELAMSSA
jgi:hypothetical protein